MALDGEPLNKILFVLEIQTDSSFFVFFYRNRDRAGVLNLGGVPPQMRCGGGPGEVS